MMNEFVFPYKSEFTAFALQDVSESSVRSYYSYLKSLDEHLFNEIDGLPKPFVICNAENLAQNSDYVLNTLDEWQTIIDGEIDEQDTLRGWTEKTIRNWRSAFNKYVEFIDEYFCGQKDIPESKEVYVPTPSPAKRKKTRAKKVIIRKSLEEKIARCLRGQDRLSAERDTNLPINYISQILTQMPGYKRGRGFINKWIRHNVKKVVAIIQDENGNDIPIHVNDIVSLKIYGKEKPVEVVYGKEKKIAIMRTRTAINETTFNNLYLENSRQLHIDHEPSVDTILRTWGNGNETLFPNLQRVSTRIRKVARDRNLDECAPHDPNLALAIKNNVEARTEIERCLPGIEEELALFDEKVTRLEFMLGSENISKGKGHK